MVMQNTFDIVKAQKALFDALLGRGSAAEISRAENILLLRDEAFEDAKRDELELRVYVAEQEAAELQAEKAKNKALVKDITTNGVTGVKLAEVNEALGRFNRVSNDTFTDFELFQIAREVDKSNLNNSEYENVTNLHKHYIIVVEELQITAEKEGGKFDVQRVTEGDLEKCSTKMYDFKPQSPTSLAPVRAEKAQNKAPELAPTH